MQYKIKLAKVGKPIWNGCTITWNDVDDAREYWGYIYKDGCTTPIYELSLTDNYYDCESIINDKGAGSYTVSIKARGDGHGVYYVDGDVSEPSEAFIIKTIEI